MEIEIPDGVIPFAKEFSKWKTPVRRTQGFQDKEGNRGSGDILDTIGSLMLWRYLVSKGVAATYLLTALEGDEADVQARYQGEHVNINVKTSRYLFKDDPCSRCIWRLKRWSSIRRHTSMYR
jgi:hypothetical protein